MEPLWAAMMLIGLIGHVAVQQGLRQAKLFDFYIIMMKIVKIFNLTK